MSEKCGFCEEAALVYYVNSGYVWGIRCGISVWPRDLTLWMLNYEPCGGVILSKKHRPRGIMKEMQLEFYESVIIL